MGALLYDALLVIALWMATLFVWVIAGDGEAVTGWPVQLTLAGELIGFYLFFWSRDGQTLGMTAWRIKLVNSDGGAPGIGQMLIRMSSALLSIAPAGLGYLWLYVGEDKQTWHDRLSNTLVVYLPKSS
jgi:uncharacterized RDD family membrane protein YckC